MDDSFILLFRTLLTSNLILIIIISPLRHRSVIQVQEKRRYEYIGVVIFLTYTKMFNIYSYQLYKNFYVHDFLNSELESYYHPGGNLKVKN